MRKDWKTIAAGWLAVGALGWAGPASGGEHLPPPSEMRHGSPLMKLLAPDAIPALEQPRLVSRAKGEKFMLPDEPVLGLVVKGEARAYSLWILDSHEIVNDTVGGTPVAATW